MKNYTWNGTGDYIEISCGQHETNRTSGSWTTRRLQVAGSLMSTVGLPVVMLVVIVDHVQRIGYMR